MLQEGAEGIVWKSFKAVGAILAIIYKLIIKPLVIPAIQHGIKHGWIFIPLGIIIGVVIHSVLYEVLDSPAVSHTLSIIMYIVLIYYGVKLMQWKRNRDAQRATTHGMFADPDVPDDLYEEDDTISQISVGTPIDLSDETGESVLFEALATLEIDGKQYVVITPQDSEFYEDGASDVYIMQMVGNLHGENVLRIIENDVEREKAFAEFEKLMNGTL